MEKNVKEITIKIEGQKWTDAIEESFVKANSKVTIDGFRPGKAPREMFMKKYSEESLYFDAADSVLQEAYTLMIEENKDVEIVAQPEINVKNIGKDGVEFLFSLTLKPTVKIKKYKGLGVKKETVKVTKEEVAASILEMRSKYAETVEKTGAIVSGDTAVIDFEGFVNGVAFDGGKGEDYSLEIGSNTFIPGFEEQLVGMKNGETKDVLVTFPEEYHSEDLKGKEATFKVTVKSIKETIVPEVNDDFFADLAIEGVNSLETLEKEVTKMMTEQKTMEADNKYIDDVIDAAIKETVVEIPDAMIVEETNRILKQYEENLKMQGLTLAQFYQFTNSNEDALRVQMKEEAFKRVISRLLLEEVAKLEGIEITDEEALTDATELALKYKMEKEEFLKLFGGLEMVKYDNKMRKAINVLKDNN
ncbi:MAG: trigger factor [Bacilli bacterium]